MQIVQDTLPSIVIIDFSESMTPNRLINAIFKSEQEENILENDNDKGNYTWRLVTKYFMANLRLVPIYVDFGEPGFNSEEFVRKEIEEKVQKPEAFVFLFSNLESILHPSFREIISKVHDMFQPELSVVFRD